MIACCDAFNAMTTDRPYREAMTVAAAVEELRANAGTQFDPRVVEALIAMVATLGGGRRHAGSSGPGRSRSPRA